MTRKPNKNQESARGNSPVGDFADMADRLNEAALLFAAVSEQARALARSATAEAERLSVSPPLAPADIENVIHHADDAAKDLIEHAVQAIKPITARASEQTVHVSESKGASRKLANLSINELRLIIENEFRTEADISGETSEASLMRIKAILDDLSKAERVGVREKLQAADTLRRLVDEFEETSMPEIPKVAPKLWADRENADESPYVFAHREYGLAAQVMTMAQFRNLDPALHSSLYRWASHKGKPPPELEIARKFTRGGPMAQRITWAEVLRDAPEHTLRKLRAYNAQKNRLGGQRPSR